jgi:hypothetical protein
MPRQDTNPETEAAEFLVLGQLLLERILAHKAYTNFPGYDLVAPHSHKKEAEQEDPEFYVLTASDAKALIVDQETKWPKIRWVAEKFAIHRRRWDCIREFLKNSNN